MKRQALSTGFTLIELIVVATILGVMLTVALVSYASTTSRSRDGKRQADVEQVRSALEMWRSDNGSYVNVSSGAVYSALSTLQTQGYIDKMPRDPKSTGWSEYLYTQAGSGATYTICARTENVIPNQSCSSCTSPYNYCTKNP
jgi:general secretion pathway protein G